MLFCDVIKITSPKVRHYNDVTKIFHFQAPPLAKSWLSFCALRKNFFTWQYNHSEECLPTPDDPMRGEAAVTV